MIGSECIHNNKGICVDGQKCHVTSVNVKNNRCFVSKHALTDCKHFRRDEVQNKRCKVLISDKNTGLTLCSKCEYLRDGSRKICTFYDKGGDDDGVNE